MAKGYLVDHLDFLPEAVRSVPTSQWMLIIAGRHFPEKQIQAALDKKYCVVRPSGSGMSLLLPL